MDIFEKHNVSTDMTSSGLYRMSCQTCEKTIICQPYMTWAKFGSLIKEFKIEHPSDEINWKELLEIFHQ